MVRGGGKERGPTLSCSAHQPAWLSEAAHRQLGDTAPHTAQAWPEVCWLSLGPCLLTYLARCLWFSLVCFCFVLTFNSRPTRGIGAQDLTHSRQVL